MQNMAREEPTSVHPPPNNIYRSDPQTDKELILLVVRCGV